MKILVLSQYFWPESFIVNDLVRELRRHGHEVEVLTGQPNYPGGRVYDGFGSFRVWSGQFEGVTVKRVPLWARRRGGVVHLALNYVSFVISAIIFGLPRLGRYDGILVYAPSPIIQVIPALVFKWLSGTPVHLWLQDLWPESLRAVGVVRSDRLLARLEKVVGWLYRRCDSVLIQSEAFRGQVERLSRNGTKIVYVPNWAEEHYRSAQAPSSVQEEMPSGFKIMFAGNLGKAQALETITEAAMELKDIDELRWIVIGDGRERESFEAGLKKRGIESRFTFLGRKPSSVMPGYLAAADVLLVTLRNDPAFSMTVPSRVQAFLACGRPIVAALNGEGRRIVDESGAGIACEAESAKDLAAGIRRIHGLGKTELEDLGRAAVSYSNAHFDRGLILSRIEDVIRRASSVVRDP